jgi:hypothetical protein
MAYKFTISDGTVLEKSIESVTFTADTPLDNSYCMRTYTINSMQITGRIGAGEKTMSLYEWALLPANNFNCYKEIVVEQTHADQTVRVVKFSKAFVVDYSESYSKGAGVGCFSIFIRQLAEVDIELTNEITPQPIMTGLSNEVEELSLPPVQSAGIVAASAIVKNNRPNLTDIIAKKKAMRDNDNGLKIEEFTAPSTGKVIKTYVDRNAVVPVDKVEKFMRGDVQDVSSELKEMNKFKQQNRKLFDSDPANAKRLDKLKDMQKNYNRSKALNQNLESIGLNNTPENNKTIFKNLLEAGNNVTPETREWFPSILEGPNGKLQMESTWKILDDGRKYLSTVVTKPINKI